MGFLLHISSTSSSVTSTLCSSLLYGLLSAHRRKKNKKTKKNNCHWLCVRVCVRVTHRRWSKGLPRRAEVGCWACSRAPRRRWWRRWWGWGGQWSSEQPRPEPKLECDTNTHKFIGTDHVTVLHGIKARCCFNIFTLMQNFQQKIIFLFSLKKKRFKVYYFFKKKNCSTWGPSMIITIFQKNYKTFHSFHFFLFHLCVWQPDHWVKPVSQSPIMPSLSKHSWRGQRWLRGKSGDTHTHTQVPALRPPHLQQHPRSRSCPAAFFRRTSRTHGSRAHILALKVSTPSTLF